MTPPTGTFALAGRGLLAGSLGRLGLHQKCSVALGLSRLWLHNKRASVGVMSNANSSTVHSTLSNSRGQVVALACIFASALGLHKVLDGAMRHGATPNERGELVALVLLASAGAIFKGAANLWEC